MGDPLKVKTAADFRDDMCRTYRNSEIKRGVTNPNTGPGSDIYGRFQAVADQLEVLSAGTLQVGEEIMPDTCFGDVLKRWLRIIGRPLRGAGPSRGQIIFETATATGVPTNAELLSPSGARFFVPVGGTYADGDPIGIQSRNNGVNQNLDAGTRLRWVARPPFAAPDAAVGTGGTSGGVDVEDDETGRARLLHHLAHPPGAGNATHVAELAEDGSVEVQKAFPYQAANGPSTSHFAVVGYATASKVRSRVVSSAGVNAARASVEAELPEHAEMVGTATEDSPADVSMQLQLPAATTAIPAGSGGGWVDGAPFPSVNGIDPTRIYTRITNLTNSTAMRVESMVAPVGGESVCFLSWSGAAAFKLYTAKILTFAENLAPSGSTPGQYDLTLDAPLTGVAVNDYVFPSAFRTQVYVDALLAGFAALGPGEKTDVLGLLPRATRRPRYFEAYPYSLGGQMLKALEDSGPEVLAAAWGYQNGGVITPAIPTLITGAPKIFVPRRCAFYQDPST